MNRKSQDVDFASAPAPFLRSRGGCGCFALHSRKEGGWDGGHSVHSNGWSKSNSLMRSLRIDLRRQRRHSEGIECVISREGRVVTAGRPLRKISKSLRTARTNQEYQRNQMAARGWPVDNHTKEIIVALGFAKWCMW